MCRDYRRRQTYNDYDRTFSETKIRIISPPRHMAPNLQPQNDINPSDPAPIFRMRAEGDGLEMITARWWFVPDTWHGTFKDFRKKLATFNARSEGAAKSPTFRKAIGSQRCLVPADGWYEWTGDKYPKTKWLFERTDQDWFCFAGLWSRFESSDEGGIETFTLLTSDSNEHLAEVHDRRPIALTRDGWERWLDEAVIDPMPADEIAVSYFSGPTPARL